MRNHYLKISALCALLILAGCQTTGTGLNPNEPLPPANPSFAGEMAKFNAQFPNAKATKYEDESLAYNNAQQFDEKGNCHGMSIHPVVIMLLLDAEGKVTSTMTDVANGKADCFRKAYASVKFPAPPIVPYRKAIRLK